MKIKNEKSFTLMEAIVAIFVITTGVVGVYSLVTQTISSATFSKDKLIAAYLAQEGIEIVRNIRDTNWLEGGTNPWYEGLTGCSTGCEVDYYCTTVVDPDSTNPPSHNCLASYGGGNFLKLDANNFYNYATGTETKFKRKITIGAGPITDSLNIKVEVFWQEKGKPYKVEAQENLYNWK
jgi:hypothetical protein